MMRAVLGVAAGIVVTAGAYFFARQSFTDETVAAGVVLGGALGTVVAGFSGGAQVAFLKIHPHSNASFVAFGVGFFAKLLTLAAGILLLGAPNSRFHPAGFAVAFVAAAIVVSGFALSEVLKKNF